MRRSVVLIPLALAACSSAPRSAPGTATAAGTAMTLCIENATAGYGNVVARVESLRYEVPPGRTQCRELTPASTSPRITANTTSGGTTGPLRFSTTVPTNGGCWRWRVATSQTEGDLLPCREGEGM
jgi:hypothetical protein